MAPYNAIFDANQVPPSQGGAAHPVGNKFPFKITHTEVVDTADKSGKMFAVELTSPAGSIVNRYNLWNNSAKAVEIAAGQFSALCHATGRFMIDFKNDGIALIGAEGLMDIGFQKGQEPSAEKPAGGYVEVKKIYDKAGNEPGKAPPQAQQNGGFGQQQSGAAPNGPQVNAGGFNPNPNPVQPPANQWAGSAGQGNQEQTAQTGGWQQGASAANPPWKS
jgi:hypothetical protein